MSKSTSANAIIYAPTLIFFLSVLATISIPVYIVLEAIFTTI